MSDHTHKIDRTRLQSDLEKVMQILDKTPPVNKQLAVEIDEFQART